MRVGAVARRGRSTCASSPATNRDLRGDGRRGPFRAGPVLPPQRHHADLPPLRERREDVLPLAEVFLARSARRAGEPAPRLGDRRRWSALARYAWPGNVRELRNVIERAVVLCQGETLTLEDLLLHEGEIEAAVAPAPASSATPPPGPPVDEQVTMRLPLRPGSPELKGKLEEFERAQILEALAKTTGNQTRAAKLLGIARRTLIKKMVRYGIERPRADGGRGEPDNTRH